MASTFRTVAVVGDIPTPLLQNARVEDLLRLQRAVQKITSILELDPLIDQIVNNVAVSFGCLEASVYLHDEEQGEMVIAGVHGCTCHAKGYRLKIGEQGMVGYVAGTRQMRYAPDVRVDPYYLACEKNTLSEVAIPLLVEDQLIGVFTASHTALDAFSPDEIRLLEAFSNHVAAAVNNARRFEKERDERQRMSREEREARIIQQALLPKSSPYIPGFAVTGLSIPAGAVGGDWYDFIPFDDGRWGLVLADVSGKGTAAALLMSATRAMIRSLAQANCAPAEVLAKLNRLLVDDFPSGRFVTLVYGVLDPAARTLTFANAGHLRPLLIHNDSAVFLEADRGTPLGLVLGEYSEHEVTLPKNSRLLFYSDGITEAENLEKQEYGGNRLRQHALGPAITPASILDDVRRFANGAGLHDDASVILVNA